MEKYLPKECLESFNELKDWMAIENLQKVHSTEWRGHHFAHVFPGETVQYAYENWQPNENDILIASFPKTGISNKGRLSM